MRSGRLLGGNTPSEDYDGVLVTLRADERHVRYVRQMVSKGVPVVDLNIDESAHATGFGASAYFIKKFKTAFGTTPRKWRLSAD